jgi:hypothetical protein
MMSLFPPRETLVSDIPAGDGNIEQLFLRCSFYMNDTMMNVQGDVSVRLGTRDPGTMREIAGKCLLKTS